MDPVIEIMAVTTPDDGILEMVEKLATLMNGLYPPESTHLTSPEELAAGANSVTEQYQSERYGPQNPAAMALMRDAVAGFKAG